MFDELHHLRTVPQMLPLLDRYGQAGAADQEAWQDRVMELPGTAPRDLVKLHGDLLAYGWLEQNTGLTPVLKAGAVPGCYRITPAGRRALQQAAADNGAEEDNLAEAA